MSHCDSKKKILKNFLLVIGNYWATLCYTIFSLNAETTIFLLGPLLFSGIGLWFLGSWCWLLELSGLELLGSCVGFGLFCRGCWPGPGCACCAAALILNSGPEIFADVVRSVYDNIYEYKN